MDLDLVMLEVQDITFLKLLVTNKHDSIIITYHPNFIRHHG